MTTEPESQSNAVATPAEFAEIATICSATEIEIGGKTVLGISDARDLHAGLGVGRDYVTWIKGRIEKYGFTEGVDYDVSQATDIVVRQNGGAIKSTVYEGAKVASIYRLTLDTAKELAMVENNEAGRLARRYFIWAEGVARQMAEGGMDRLQLNGIVARMYAVVQQIGARVQPLEAAVAAMEENLRIVANGYDPASSMVTNYQPMLTVLVGEGVSSKRRRQLSQKCSRRCARWMIDAGRGSDLRVSRESGRYLFHTDAVKVWLAAEGRQLIREHRDEVAGQTVMKFKPKAVPDPTVG